MDSKILSISNYKKEDYPEIIRISEDGNDMFATWEEWDKSSAQHIK